jgi:hypothetical protein
MDRWTPEERHIAGAWCANLLTEGLPDVFVWEEFSAWNKDGRLAEKFLRSPSPRRRIASCGTRSRNWCNGGRCGCRGTKPEPWNSWKMKPSEDDRVFKQVSLLRTHNNDQIAATKRAIADGTAAPTLRGHQHAAGCAVHDQ